MERYIRQTMLPEVGEEGQRRLALGSALIVGVGGLGSPVALYLAASGIGRIGLADIDVVSESNLQRQVLYGEPHLGLPKVDCARERLAALASPSCALITHPGGLTAENACDIISGYDVVLDCTDNFSARLMIDEACFRLGKPWVHASIDGFCGQVTVFNHRAGKLYRDLYPDADALADMPRRTIGTVGPTPGVAGSLQAAEAMKLIMGIGLPLDGRLLTFDILNMDFNIVEF